MKLGYVTEGLDSLYEVMHAWSIKEYFNKCGVEVIVANSDEVKEIKETRIIDRIKKAFFINKRGNIIKDRYEEFISNYLDISDKNFRGSNFPYLYNVFGELTLKKGCESDLTEDECEGNYLSSVMLLNQKDYLKFIKPIKEKTPYILTYIESDEIYKTEYINNFIEKKKGRQIVVSKNPKNYNNSKLITEPGPEEVMSLLFYADGIITDSLIILELAIIFHKNFLYLNGGKGEGKAVLMLEQMNLLHHFVHDVSAKTVPARYINPPSKVLWIRTLKARKQVIKLVQRLFPEADIDGLDVCECPTDITRTECYGCLACKEVCPTNAITMLNDSEEFQFPYTDYHKCIECGLCKKICIRNKPTYKGYESGYPKAVCAKNNDKEVLYKSTSGAVFPELARYVIEEKKGAVVGVRYGEDVIDVRSDIAFTMDEVEAFYGSKYVKSEYDGIFPKIQTILKEGKYVLYSGLPCECAGLRAYLQKDYDNLLICEILCHSVPSPKIYRKYVKYLQGKRKSKVTNLVFRKKTETFPKMEITYRKGLVIQARYGRNNYFRAFHNDYISRTSCSKCQYTYLKRSGDITLGDFWGVELVFPDMPDKTGISCVLFNTQKGYEAFENISSRFDVKEITAKQAFIKNHKKSKPLTPEREELFRLLEEDMQINALLERYNDLIEKPEIKEIEDDPDTQIIHAADESIAAEVLTEADINEKDEEASDYTERR